MSIPGWWTEATDALATIEIQPCSWEPASLTDTYTGTTWTHWDYASHLGSSWVGACPKILPEALSPDPSYRYELACFGSVEEEHDGSPAGWRFKCEFEQKGDEGLAGSIPVDCSREEGSDKGDTGWVQHGSAFDCGQVPGLIARLASVPRGGGPSTPSTSPPPTFSPKGTPASVCNRLTPCKAHPVLAKSIQTGADASVVAQGWMKIALMAAPICAARFGIDAALMASTIDALNTEASTVGTLSGDAGQDLYGMLLEQYLFGATPVCEVKSLGQTEPGAGALNFFGLGIQNLPVLQPLAGDGVMEQSTRAAFVWNLLATLGGSESQGLLRVDYIQRANAFDVCRVQAAVVLRGLINAEARPLDIYYPAVFGNCKSGFRPQTAPPQQASATVLGSLVKVAFEASAPLTVVSIHGKASAGRTTPRADERGQGRRLDAQPQGMLFEKSIRTVAGRRYKLHLHVPGASSVQLRARGAHRLSAPVVLPLKPHGKGE